MSFTFAKGRRAVPLRRMAGNAADNDLTDKFIALVTEEAQSFSSLIGVLVKSLVTVVGDSGVWARVIFYCSQHTKTHGGQSRTCSGFEMCRKGRLNAGSALTDTLWAAVAPFGGAGVSSMAGDLAGAFQLIALVTGETDHCPNSKTCFGAHRARSIYHLSWIRTLLYCRGNKTDMML